MTAAIRSRSRSAVRKAEITVDRRFRIPFRVYGEAGPLLVCINGIVQSMAVWQPVVQAMQDSHRVLVFDLPGQGRACFVGGPRRVDFDDQVRIIDALLREIGEKERVRILSASYGSVIACIYAQRRPQRVDKLLLCSLSIEPGDLLRRVQKRLVALIDGGQTAAIAELIIASGGGSLPERLAASIRRQFADIDSGQLAMFRAHLLWLLGFEPGRDSPFRFSRIRAQTLILAGEADPVLNRADLARVARQVPDCRVRYLPGAGHFLHLEEGKSDLVWHYRDFLVSATPAAKSSPCRGAGCWPLLETA